MKVRSSPWLGVVRALRLRCPRCGGGPLRAGPVRLREVCPSCGLRIERGEADAWLGAMAINMMVSEFGFGIMLALVAWATWPRVPWGAIEVVGVSGAIVAPILFYPFSKTLRLAVDLMFRREPADE
jgi:uncharacterized protein (DUF983 family)